MFYSQLVALIHHYTKCSKNLDTRAQFPSNFWMNFRQIDSCLCFVIHRNLPKFAEEDEQQ